MYHSFLIHSSADGHLGCWKLITLQYCSGFFHTLTWICHGCTCVPYPEPPFHIPPHTIPLGHPIAPALSIQYHALNLDWWFISHMILYMFQCHSPKSSHPLPLPQSPKDFYTSVSLLLSHIQGYCYHLSKFHIYVLVYCIGVWLTSGSTTKPQSSRQYGTGTKTEI